MPDPSMAIVKLAALPVPVVLDCVTLVMVVAPTVVNVSVASFSASVPPRFDPVITT